MKKLGFVLIPLVTLFAAACNEREVQGAHGKELGLTAPADQTIKQGAANDVAVKIDRGDFAGPVTIEFTGLPAGVTVANLGPIATGEEMKSYTLRAAPTATLVDDHLVTVVATAADMRVQQTFKVDVEAP